MFSKTIKKTIKAFIPQRLKCVYWSVLGFKKHFGYYPNIFFPSGYSEKIQNYKIFNRDPRLPLRQDKVLVKNVVAEKLGTEYVIPTLWHGVQLPLRQERNWPMPFVIKANHGCGWNIFVHNETECNWDEIEKECELWMSQKWGHYMGEWLYSKIKPQLLVEPYINQVATLPVDYKLWVFGGRVELIQVILGRGTDMFRHVFYDKNWIRQPYWGLDLDDAKEDILPPKSIEKMISAATILGEDFPFVRIDFYEVNEQPLFGEMTFYPASGFSPFTPIQYEKHVGEMWY